jgi:nucleotide-binding universal stress UspA family protein
VIQAAAAMAARYGASLSLVNVVELAPQALEVDYSVFRGALIEAANLKLEELKKALGVDAPHRVVDGAVAAAIREEAVRTGADLIVAGRGHQQETVGRMWSSLYEIVREAPCPVLSV